jgi:hypothetical protein
MLSETSQVRKDKSAQSHSSVNSKNIALREVEAGQNAGMGKRWSLAVALMAR